MINGTPATSSGEGPGEDPRARASRTGHGCGVAEADAKVTAGPSAARGGAGIGALRGLRSLASRTALRPALRGVGHRRIGAGWSHSAAERARSVSLPLDLLLKEVL